MTLTGIDHVAIICSDYARSRKFYVETLGLSIIAETNRSERNSCKLDLAMSGKYVIELFSFPHPPIRLTNPEACGLRHLAFVVENLEESIAKLSESGVIFEEIREDAIRGNRFVFFRDPDGLPLELCERSSL